MAEVAQNWDLMAFTRQIKHIVSQISRIDEAELEDHLLVREELGVDSLMAMEIIAKCEKQLKIKLDETLFADVQTVKDFIDLLFSVSKAKHG